MSFHKTRLGVLKNQKNLCYNNIQWDFPLKLKSGLIERLWRRVTVLLGGLVPNQGNYSYRLYSV